MNVTLLGNSLPRCNQVKRTSLIRVDRLGRGNLDRQTQTEDSHLRKQGEMGVMKL